MAGFSYLVAQLALLLLVALVLGTVAGRYLWPGRARGRADGPEAEELRMRVVASEATVQELRTTVSTITDHKDAEIGWLETRAIQAMDSLVRSHDERVLALQTQVETATAQTRHQERELEAERRHTLRLQAALVERDERITTLTADLADKDRRLSLLSSTNGVHVD
jgi:predicted RNase H-like nuclease (RuvC/YqgF family)